VKGTNYETACAISFSFVSYMLGC